MPKYIFLDNWVLSKFSRGDPGLRLASFLEAQGYTIIITSLLLTELYNPGWGNAPEKDRNVAVTRFLGAAPCVVVDPAHIFRAEIDSYPGLLEHMPIELDFAALPAVDRAAELLKFLRRHEDYLSQGKDIAIWAERYQELKNSWLGTAQAIINHACKDEVLTQGDLGRFIDLEASKELFLLSVDLRHAASVEIELFFSKMEAAKNSGHLVNLRGVRLTSLCMWYAYIDFPPEITPQRRKSDIGDYYHIGLIPYCAAFTIDGPMQSLVYRFQEQHLIEHCILYNETQLRGRLQL